MARNIAAKEIAPILIKSAEFIAERLPSIYTAETKSSSPKAFVDGREVAVNMQVCLSTGVTS